MCDQSDLPDCTSHLSDSLLLKVFSLIPIPNQIDISIVCKRWYRVQGLLLQSLTLHDWSFLCSGRIFRRFPNLTQIDLTRSLVHTDRNSSIFVTSRLSVPVCAASTGTNSLIIPTKEFLSPGMVDYGLGLISEYFPKLRSLSVIGPSEDGMFNMCSSCLVLQELDLHSCDDFSLKGIAKCQNLQELKLIGKVDGLYDSVISDIGLTIIANGCPGLVKLELHGCEGSYDGLKAIGQCCPILEEMSLKDHRMDGGWLSALSYCSNLRRLKLVSCKGIDVSPGPDEHLGECRALEELKLEMCRLKGNNEGVMALFSICRGVGKLQIMNCVGLEDEILRFAIVLRDVKELWVEGCSLLTTTGLESLILKWNGLECLQVVSCNNVRDTEVSVELSSLFSVLKELRWRPDTKFLLASALADTGVYLKGTRFFKC